MEHARIFLNFGILLLGSWTISYVWRTYRTHQEAFLKPLFHFIWASNVVILIDLTARYSCINLVRDCRIFESTVYARIMGPLSSFFFLWVTFFLVHTVMMLCNKPIPFKISRLWGAFISLLSISYIVRIILSLNNIFVREFPVVQYAILRIDFLFLICVLCYLIIQGFRQNNFIQKQAMISFSGFYLFGFLAPLVAKAIPKVTVSMISSLVFILINLFPFIWLRRFALTRKDGLRVEHNSDLSLDLICSLYGISKRERQIIELILQGKSNKEIEGLLFISPHTVKNHIYNLYQKLGVKSRGQLVNLVLESNMTNRQLYKSTGADPVSGTAEPVIPVI